MDNRSEDIDDDFNDIYKEYTGPMGSKSFNTRQDVKVNKRSHEDSDDEKELPDPNAVPTDFTSREAKVWEAKSRATERNWKKRKEEEMICKLCGESGHFTQGCPSTLGANRKSQDFFERVAARDKHVKARFTPKVVHKIEKDIGCKLKIEEKFIIVSGKDRLILAKGVDAVHKAINEESSKMGSPSSHGNKSRSPETNPSRSKHARSESQRSFSSSKSASQNQPRYGRQDKVVEDRARENSQKISRASPSPQARAYGNDGGARSRSSHSRSPGLTSHRVSLYNSHGNGFDTEPASKFDNPIIPRTLEDLEMEYKREATELERVRDKEESDETYKHREAVRELRETYMKKFSNLRGRHVKQWDEFLERQPRIQPQDMMVSVSGFGAYGQPGYADYEGSSRNSFFAANFSMDMMRSYPASIENYPSSMPTDPYGEFQRQRRDDFEKAYNRY